MAISAKKMILVLDLTHGGRFFFSQKEAILKGVSECF